MLVMKSFSKKDFWQWLIVAACFFVILFSIFTVVKASAYSVLVEDDFWHGNDVGVFGGGVNYVIASLKYSSHMYFNWQGTYFSMFIQALLSPVNHYGMTQLRIVMILNAIIFFASFIGCIYAVLTRLIKEEWKLKLMVCACAVFTVTAYNTFEEVFYWFSGAASYSIPLSCLFYSWIALCMYDLAVQKKYKYLFIALAMILGICAMGGSLAVAAAGCCMLSLLCLYQLLAHKKVSCVYLTVLAVYFAGAVINVAAPGNYIRQKTSEGEGLQVFSSFINTCRVYESNLHWIFKRTDFGLVLLVILICGMFLHGKIKADMVKYTIVSVMAVVAPFIIIFPVVLGYGVPWMPNRCVFVLLVSFIFVFGNMGLIGGWWIVEIVSIKSRTIVIVMTVLLIFATGTVNEYRPSDYSSIKIFKKLCTGTLQNYYNEYIDMLSLIEEAQGTDLVLFSEDIPEPIDDFYCFELSEETDSRMNSAIADIYHLNSIAKGTE